MTPAGLTEFIAHLSVCRGHTEGSPAEGHVLPRFSPCKQQQQHSNDDNAEVSTTNVRQRNTTCHRFTVGHAGRVRVLRVCLPITDAQPKSGTPPGAASLLSGRRAGLREGRWQKPRWWRREPGGREMGNEAQQAAPGSPSRRS